MSRTQQIWLPIGILVVTGLVTFAIVKLRTKPESKEREKLPVLVEVVEAHKENTTLTVMTQGTVVARTETTLIPQVSGKVIEISPSLYVGGFFEQGEVLLHIDPSDYEVAVTRAEAALAQAQLNYEQEKALADQARKDWEKLGNGKPTSLVLREPQLLDAEAGMRSAEADLDKARRDLERTRIRAPYAGMVKEKYTDVGQYVSPGTQLAKIFAVDYAEVRLPIPTRELAYLKLPLGYRGDGPETTLPVRLKAEYGGREYSWDARIVRTEGTIDTRSRVVYAVAKVDDPYAPTPDGGRPPLQIGTFVQAEIFGNAVKNAVVLPRHVLRGRDNILIVKPGNTLETRTVEVLRADERNVVISSGIEEGERVCLTTLEFYIDGMKVRIAPQDRGAGES